MAFVIDDAVVASAVESEVAVEATSAATGSAMAVEASTAASGATMMETASATGSIAESEATAAFEVVAESPSVVEAPAVEGDFVQPIEENTADLSNVTFFDEYPTNETSVKSTDLDNIVDSNVFYDEFPSQSVSEVDSATESINESPQEIETPKSYKELCETRDCGGSYKDLKNEGWGWNDNPPHEVHHMPADSASHLEREDGPAIAIDYYDHQQTASCGSSREAKEYRAAQKDLIDKGDFRGALQMDLDDLHDKFGDKYDKAISQMMDYVDKLEQAGKI